MAITNFNFPRVTVNQEFTGAGTATDAALPVCVIGPEYAVKTYAKYGAQLLIGDFGGTYTDIPYPGNTIGGTVNPDSVELFVKDAHVQLFNSAELTGVKFATIKSASGTDVLNKVVCLRTTTTGGDPESGQSQTSTDIPVALRSGNGFARDAAVATNIAAGDILVLAGVEYVISDIQRKDNRYSVLVLTKALPAAVTNAAASIVRVKDVVIDATVATAQTLTCPTTAKVSIVNSQGQPVDGCVVTKGSMYAQYSVRITTHVNMLGSVASGQGMLQALNDIFQGLDNNNPLGQGVYAACTTAGGTIVYFTAVARDTVQDYAQAMDFIAGKDTCYSCVILSQDPAVIKTCLEFANQQSDAQIPSPKIIWAGMSNPDAVVLSNIVDYTIEPTGTSIKVLDLSQVSGVIPGDYIKWASDTDIYGAPVYAEVQITGVALGTLSFAAADLDTMSGSISIVRKKYSKLELVQHIIANKYVADRRAAVVYADDAVFNGQIVPGYIAAACAAGMRAKQQAHRPLSNMPYDALTVLQTHGLSLSNLKTLGANGIWIIGNNADGTAVNKRQLTSAAADDINFDEQSLTTNVDSFILVIKHVGQDMVGNSNISPALLQSLDISIRDILDAFITYSQSAQVGPQFLQAQLLQLVQDAVNLDTVYADIVLDPPKPFNRLHIRVRLA